MIICILSSKFPPTVGGGETYSYQLAKTLSLRGHSVFVLTNKLNHIEQINSNGFQVIGIAGFNEESPIIQTCLPALYQALNFIKPDIIHVNNYIPMFLFNQIKEVHSSAKVILSIHNTPDFPKRVFGLFQNFESEVTFARKILLENDPLLVLGSQHFVNSVQVLSENSARIKLHYFGADTSVFNPLIHFPEIRTELGLDPKDKLLLCPSRIIRRKGIEEAIKSLTLLPFEYKMFFPAAFQPNDPIFFNYLQNIVVTEKLESRVIWGMKHYKYSDMPLLYNNADIVVMPSYYEGFSMGILEAMAMKRLVVSCNVNGVNEAVLHMHSGLLARVKDYVSLAENISLGLSDKHLGETIVTNAYKRIVDELNLDSYIKKLLEIYQNELRR